jgi:carboxyl-terminal processing protease
MRFFLRGSLAGLTGLLLAAPLSAQTPAAPATARSAAAPAAASSAAGPNEDAIDLDDVRRFSRVYEVVRQA